MVKRRAARAARSKKKKRRLEAIVASLGRDTLPPDSLQLIQEQQPENQHEQKGHLPGDQHDKF